MHPRTLPRKDWRWMQAKSLVRRKQPLHLQRFHRRQRRNLAQRLQHCEWMRLVAAAMYERVDCCLLQPSSGRQETNDWKSKSGPAVPEPPEGQPAAKRLVVFLMIGQTELAPGLPCLEASKERNLGEILRLCRFGLKQYRPCTRLLHTGPWHIHILCACYVCRRMCVNSWQASMAACFEGPPPRPITMTTCSSRSPKQ